MKVARSTRSGRDTTEQLRQDTHLYTRALVGRDYFQPGTPLAERCWRLTWHDFRGPRSWPANLPCWLLTIEASASKSHVLEERTKRIGEGVVQSARMVLTGDHLAAGKGVASNDWVSGLCKRRYLCMPCTIRVSDLPLKEQHHSSIAFDVQ